MAQAHALAAHMRNKGAGHWTAEALGRATVSDRVLAVTDKALAWGVAPHIAFVEVDIQERIAVEVEQVADGSWSVEHSFKRDCANFTLISVQIHSSSPGKIESP